MKKTVINFSIIIFLPIIVHFLGIFNILSPNPLYLYFHLGNIASSLLDGSPGWVDPNAGATTQALGTLAARQWLSGHIPWWDSFSGMGLPLAAEMQSSVLFLPFILLLYFSNGILYIKISLQIVTGLFSYALFRQMRLSRLAVVSGAVLMEMSGAFAWFAHAPIMPLPFLPLLLWGILRCCQDNKREALQGTALVCLGISGAIFAGFPETAYMNGLFALLFACWALLFVSHKALFSAKLIAGGGIIGLLVSSPAWMPFFSLLRVSFLGQNQDSHGAHFLLSNLGQTLFPYLFGPPLYQVFNGRVNTVDVWWHTGGYCDFAIVFAGIFSIVCSLFFRTHYRKLTFFIGAYMLVTALKAVGFAPVSKLLDLIPGIRQCMFYIYISPGWWCALAILFAIVLDDLSVIPKANRLKALKYAMAASLCVGLIALCASLPLVKKLLFIQHYVYYPVFSLAWAGLVFSLLVYGFLRNNRKLVACTAILNATALFFYPTLTGVRPKQDVDQALLAMLKTVSQKARVVSAATFAPNYGAFYGIATVNYTYLPLPESFSGALDANICNGYDHTQFFTSGFGRLCRPELSINAYSTWQSPAISTLQGLTWLKNHNVGYLLYPKGHDVWRDAIGTSLPPEGNRYQTFTSAPQEGDIVNDELSGATLHRVGVGLGTYVGHATGGWHAALCSESQCVQADGRLEQAADNQVTWLDLPHPLTMPDHARTLHYKVWSDETASPAALAVWTSHASAMAQILPLVTVDLDIAPFTERKVFEDSQFSLEALPNTQPYYYAPDCTVTFISRLHARATCVKETDLIRNELFYPTWTATLNGKPQSVDQEPNGFRQSLHLPEGESDIYWDYAPAHIKVIYVLFLAGVLGTLGVLIRSRSVSAT
nr:hypothetical protein [uncultured Acetobacter sp.]